MRSILTLLIAVLLLLGCKPPPQTFLAKSIQLPKDNQDEARLGQDFNDDGQIDRADNSLLELSNIFLTFKDFSNDAIDIDLQAQLDDAISSGTLLLALDLSAPLLQEDNLLAYLATAPEGVPAFDGTDVLVADDSFLFNEAKLDHQALSTARSTFLFPLVILPGELTVFRLDNAVLTGTVDLEDGVINAGTLSGTISALEFAKRLGVFATLAQRFIVADAERYNPDAAGNPGAPIQCSADIDCLAQGLGSGECTEKDGQGASTGSCVAADALASLSIIRALDPNKDGRIEVVFNEAQHSFTTNDLLGLFSMDPSCDCSPSGLFGSLFDLDLDLDGNIESMGVGIGFDGVAASHQ